MKIKGAAVTGAEAFPPRHAWPTLKFSWKLSVAGCSEAGATEVNDVRQLLQPLIYLCVIGSGLLLSELEGKDNQSSQKEGRALDWFQPLPPHLLLQCNNLLSLPPNCLSSDTLQAFAGLLCLLSSTKHSLTVRPCHDIP